MSKFPPEIQHVLALTKTQLLRKGYTEREVDLAEHVLDSTMINLVANSMLNELDHGRLLCAYKALGTSGASGKN